MIKSQSEWQTKVKLVTRKINQRTKTKMVPERQPEMWVRHWTLRQSSLKLAIHNSNIQNSEKKEEKIFSRILSKESAGNISVQSAGNPI